MSRKKKPTPAPRVLDPGGRPRNDSRYPAGKVFDAQALRFALTAKHLTIREFIARLDTEQGIRVHRSTAWRWTMHNLYPKSSTPPLVTLRAIERVLRVSLLKDGKR